MKKSWSFLLVPFAVSAAGLIVFSQAISFGWPQSDGVLSELFSVRVHSVMLAVTGLILLLLGGFIRSTNARMARLEEEMEKLKKGQS